MPVVAFRPLRQKKYEVAVVPKEKAREAIVYLVRKAGCQLKAIPQLCSNDFWYYQIRRRGKWIGSVTYKDGAVTYLRIN